MSTAELPKQYDPKAAQDRWYPVWLERGYFHAPDAPSKPYSIVIPPPNVTGALHLGHALNNTLQDILIRWRRMQGFDALWMPGTDHAGIATQAVVEKRIFAEEKKTRHDLGREALVERIWAWKDEYEKRILNQLRLMGCSCDWDRTRFTLDDICARTVRETFFRLFQAGKIFRGKRLVNWDTHLQTAVADDEIYYEDIQGTLWTIKYPVAGSTTGEALVVATTRPETMLGDTAVAVHPDDERYRHLIGQEVDLPLTDRRIPIIADAILVDPKFGTGCVKVTPAHDPNDYQTGLRHDLPQINLLNPDGTYNENAGARYAGKPGKEVRKRVVDDLKGHGLLVKEEPYQTRLNYSDRSKTPIEPYLSDQWFVRMGDDPDGTPGFAQQAMDAVTSGRVKIHPERYAKSYLDWLGEKRDWCISRQLWWGHRIPVWWLRGFEGAPDESTVMLKRISELPQRFGHRRIAVYAYEWGESGPVDPSTMQMMACVRPDNDEIERELESLGFKQDPDVLDTWFSSALWPHSTLGWPEDNPALRGYYPTSVLSTARDIITLWVARMVIFGQFNMGDVPFRDVFIHPVIQDGDGKRMSKTAGNGIDPVDIIEAYGADALRYTLAISATETQDLRMPVEPVKDAEGRVAVRKAPGQPLEFIPPAEAKALPKELRVNTSPKFEEGRTFPNKFWNAARFALINLEGYDAEFDPGDLSDRSPADLWILGGLARVTREVTLAFERFQFAEATRQLRDFTWNNFCDWYVELIKRPLRSDEDRTRQLTQHTLISVLDALCRLLHPIVPFVTEEVWQALNQVAPMRRNPITGAVEAAAESICVASWPTLPDTWAWPEADQAVAQLQEKVTAIRTLRAERGVPAAAKIAPTIVASGRVAGILTSFAADIQALTGSGSLQVVEAFDRPADSAVVVLADAEIILPLEGLIDKGVELVKQRKELDGLDRQIDAARKKLENPRFVDNAPADVVAGQRARLAELETRRESVARLIASLGGTP